jgi:hypothetical protein
MKAQSGSRSIVLLFNLGIRLELFFNPAPRPLYPWERDPVPILQATGLFSWKKVKRRLQNSLAA